MIHAIIKVIILCNPMYYPNENRCVIMVTTAEETIDCLKKMTEARRRIDQKKHLNVWYMDILVIWQRTTFVQIIITDCVVVLIFAKENCLANNSIFIHISQKNCSIFCHVRDFRNLKHLPLAPAESPQTTFKSEMFKSEFWEAFWVV